MTDPIRLALVITELEPGGAERCLVNLATRIDRQRFEPVVYSLGPRPPACRDVLVGHLEAAGVPVQFLGLTHWSQYFHGVRRLAGMLAEQRTQIVQSFLFHANVLAARAAVHANVPHVCTGIRVADPRRTRTSVERWATGRADRHVCVSQSVAHFCRQRGFAAEKVVVIPNGIDVDRWKNARPSDLTQFGVPAGRRAIVYVGRLDPQKGLAQFFGELTQLFKHVPDHDLLMVGDGPEAAVLKQAAHSLGVADRVHFAGWQADVPEIVSASDLLVLPSLWEGMPNVVLEAMAAGKPVVATRSEGVAELLGEGVAEQSVEIAQFDQFPDMASAMLNNPNLANELGRQNKRRAEQHFSLTTMVGRYEELFTSLADR